MLFAELKDTNENAYRWLLRNLQFPFPQLFILILILKETIIYLAISSVLKNRKGEERENSQVSFSAFSTPNWSHNSRPPSRSCSWSRQHKASQLADCRPCRTWTKKIRPSRSQLSSSATVRSEARPQLQNSLRQLNQVINHLRAQAPARLGILLDILTTSLEQEIRANSSKYNTTLAYKDGNEVFY